jgi:DNA-binding Lrp family transcriptional regulator
VRIGDVDVEILELFSQRLLAYYSINQIAKKLGKKYPYVNKRVGYLVELGILRKSVIGSSHLISVNLSSDKCVMLLSMVEVEKRDRAIERQNKLQKVLALLDEEKRLRNIYCALVSSNKLIVVTDEVARKRSVGGIDSLFVTREQFRALMLDGDIVNNHLILCGFEAFFGFVKGAEKELRVL